MQHRVRWQQGTRGAMGHSGRCSNQRHALLPLWYSSRQTGAERLVRKLIGAQTLQMERLNRCDWVSLLKSKSALADYVQSTQMSRWDPIRFLFRTPQKSTGDHSATLYTPSSPLPTSRSLCNLDTKKRALRTPDFPDIVDVWFCRKSNTFLASIAYAKDINGRIASFKLLLEFSLHFYSRCGMGYFPGEDRLVSWDYSRGIEEQCSRNTVILKTYIRA